MTFAAWFDLHADDVVAEQPTALRVYAWLLRNDRILEEPQEIKAWVVAEQLHVHRDSVKAALMVLIERGYVVEHPRGYNNVRRLSVATERDPSLHRGCPSNPAAPSSA